METIIGDLDVQMLKAHVQNSLNWKLRLQMLKTLEQGS